MSRWDTFICRLKIFLQDIDRNDVAMPPPQSLLTWRQHKLTIDQVLLSLLHLPNLENSDIIHKALSLDKRFERGSPLPAANLNSMMLYIAYVDLLANGPIL